MNSPSVFYGMAESETRTSVLPAETVASRPDSQATSTGVVILDGNTRSDAGGHALAGKKNTIVGGQSFPEIFRSTAQVFRHFMRERGIPLVGWPNQFNILKIAKRPEPKMNPLAIKKDLLFARSVWTNNYGKVAWRRCEFPFHKSSAYPPCGVRTVLPIAGPRLRRPDFGRLWILARHFNGGGQLPQD